MAKWAVGLNHRRVPSARGLELAWTPVRLADGGVYPYGFGWDLTEQRGHPRIGHTGSWQGFKTAIYRYPELDLTVIVLANLAQAEPGAIAEGIAGILEPSVQPPQLLAAALAGPKPPVSVPDLLGRIAAGTDSSDVTPGLHRFLTPAARKEVGDLLSPVRSWSPLGGDNVGNRGITKLDARIERVCYARGVGKTSRVVVSMFYASDWRAAHFESQDY